MIPWCNVLFGILLTNEIDWNTFPDLLWGDLSSVSSIRLFNAVEYFVWLPCVEPTVSRVLVDAVLQSDVNFQEENEIVQSLGVTFHISSRMTVRIVSGLQFYCSILLYLQGWKGQAVAETEHISGYYFILKFVYDESVKLHFYASTDPDIFHEGFYAVIDVTVEYCGTVDSFFSNVRRVFFLLYVWDVLFIISVLAI